MKKWMNIIQDFMGSTLAWKKEVQTCSDGNQKSYIRLEGKRL